jgi:hypothetical protein
MTPGDEKALEIAVGCCGDDSWRGRLCGYHQGFADGFDEATGVIEMLRDEVMGEDL